MLKLKVSKSNLLKKFKKQIIHVFVIPYLIPLAPGLHIACNLLDYFPHHKWLENIKVFIRVYNLL